MATNSEDINKRIENYIKSYMDENEDGLTKKEIFLKAVYDSMAVYEDGHNEIEIINFNSEGFGIRVDAYDFIGENQIDFYISEYDNGKEFLDRDSIIKEVNKVIKFITFSLGQMDQIFKKDDPLYSLSNYIRESFASKINYRIYFITNSSVVCDKVDSTKFIYQKSSRKVEILVYDISDIHELGVFTTVENKRVDVNFRDDFNIKVRAVNGPIQSDIFNPYLIFVKGIVLARTYGEYGYQFLNGNVRAYLKKTQKVNKGIYETIKTNPELFVAYNNGISSVAQSLEFDDDGNLIEIKGWQIVNGGQTTATLYEALKDNIDLSKVVVPVKICELGKNSFDNEEMIANISEYANTQSKVAKSDFSSNEKYHIDMEKYSKMISIDCEVSSNAYEKWFYERTKGQYELTRSRDINGNFSIEFPKEKKFDKTELAKAIMSWEQEPFTVSLGKENNFQAFNNMIKQGLIDNNVNEDYYKKSVASVILFRKINDVVNEEKYGGFKANIVTYTMAILSFLTDRELNLMDIWNKQDISFSLKEIIRKITHKINSKIQETPSNNTNVQMWCRKKECWDNVKTINFEDIDGLYDMCTHNVSKDSEKQYIKFKDKMLSIEQINISMLDKLIRFGLLHEIISESDVKIFNIITVNIRNHKPLTSTQLDYIGCLITKCLEQGFSL